MMETSDTTPPPAGTGTAVGFEVTPVACPSQAPSMLTMLGLSIFALLAMFTGWGGDGAGAPGAALALTALVGVCCVHGYRTKFKEQSSTCGCCFALCMDCTKMSNAWHLRNLFVAIFIMSIPALVTAVLTGLSLLAQDPFCLYRCNVRTWQQCPYCGGGVILANDAQNRLASDCCNIGVNRSGTCDTRHKTLTCPFDDNTLKPWGGCEAVCVTCLGGFVTRDECYTSTSAGIAGIINAAAMLGVSVLSFRLLTVLGQVVHVEGWQGRPQVLVLPPTVVGQQMASGGAGTTMVIGQPVIGNPVSVAVPPAAMRGGGGKSLTE